MKSTLILAATLALATSVGCTKKNDTEPVGGVDSPTPAETVQATMAASTSAEPVETGTAAASVGDRYHLFDSGIRCVTSPCPSWTARPESGDDVSVTHVDLAPLKLSKEKELSLRPKLATGYWVSAEILEGPKEPAGTGVTIRIYELHEPATK